MTEQSCGPTTVCRPSLGSSPISLSRQATLRHRKYTASPDLKHSDRVMRLGCLQLARRALEKDAPETTLHKLTEDAPPDCTEAEIVLHKFAEHETRIPIYKDTSTRLGSVGGPGDQHKDHELAEDQLPAQARLRGSFLSFAAAGRNCQSTKSSASRACGAGSIGTPVSRHRALHNSKTLGPDQTQKTIPAGRCCNSGIESDCESY